MSVMSVIQMIQRQGKALQLLWSTPQFRAPLITIWVASFGGSLHAPVTTGFVRKLGATTSDIGTMGAIISVGMVLLSPVYGWLLDRFGGFVPIVLACFFCATGCAVRGFAGDVPALFLGSFLVSLGAGNLWTVVLSFISTNSSREIRSTVVSAFLFQVAVLRVAGKCMYAPFDMALHSIFGFDDDLFRDRITMSVCTFFCIFGVFLLLVMPSGGNDTTGEASGTMTDIPGKNENPINDSSAPPASEVTIPSDTDSTASQWPFITLSTVLFLQSASLTGTNTLWPIVLQDDGDFGNRIYGVVLFSASFLATMAMGAEEEKEL